MPDSVMTLFPNMLNSLEAMKMPLQASLAFNRLQMQSLSASVEMYKSTQNLTLSLVQQYSHLLPAGYLQNSDKLLRLYQEAAASPSGALPAPSGMGRRWPMRGISVTSNPGFAVCFDIGEVRRAVVPFTPTRTR